MTEMLGIVLRISFMYVYILAILRFSGKRSIDTISPLDFLVALIVGDMFDDVIWAEVPLAQGVVGMTTIILLHTLVSFAEAHSTRIKHLVSSQATLMIQNAALQPAGMQQQRTNEEELWSLLRMSGQDQLEEVREAYMETKGVVSTLPTEAADDVQKQDREKVKDLVRS